MANDLLVGNKHIPRIYFGNKGVASVYFGNKLIWPNNTQKTLVAGDICVAIEYVPTNDITVDSLEIFSHETTSYTTGRIQIIHESGLYVGSFNGNGQDSIETKYTLEGRARTLNNVDITLYKDEKYYIIFQDKDTTKWYTGNIVFKPAYFANEEGNYKANVYDNTDATTLHPYSNIKNIKEFLPSVGTSITETDLQSILKLDTNELFLWNGNDISVNNQTVLHDDHLGKKLTTKETNPPITTGDGDVWTYNQNQVFVRHNYGNDVVNRIWKKTSNVKSNGTITTTKTVAVEEFIEILLSLGNDTNKKALNNDSANMLSNYVGNLFQLNSNYAPDSSLSYTPLTTLPEGTNYHFYYIDGNAFSTAHGTGLYVYENGDFTYIFGSWGGEVSNFLSYFSLSDISSIMQQVNFTDVVQEDQQISCNTEVRDATVLSGRKYYLKINGNEV